MQATKVSYTPMAPGNYLISIKYGGPQHIVGSPFKAKVSGPRLSGGHSLHETSSVLVETVTKSSAASMGGVVSRGAGLSKAFIGQKNTFTVDCSKAGTNMLMVASTGRRRPARRCTSSTWGTGSTSSSWKWGDENIPGSPFHVTVP
uniref:Uncharacterized protein n=1 Tax=Salarias fasciatus TaxID=181472 RepID=A0A672FS27_SALFA